VRIHLFCVWKMSLLSRGLFCLFFVATSLLCADTFHVLTDRSILCVQAGKFGGLNNRSLFCVNRSHFHISISLCACAHLW